MKYIAKKKCGEDEKIQRKSSAILFGITETSNPLSYSNNI